MHRVRKVITESGAIYSGSNGCEVCGRRLYPSTVTIGWLALEPDPKGDWFLGDGYVYWDPDHKGETYRAAPCID